MFPFSRLFLLTPRLPSPTFRLAVGDKAVNNQKTLSSSSLTIK